MEKTNSKPLKKLSLKRSRSDDLKNSSSDTNEESLLKKSGATESSSFAQALSKVLSRSITTTSTVSHDTKSTKLTLSGEKSGNRVLAKRHTALQKLQEKEAAAAAISRQRKKDLRNRRQAINVDPKQSPPDFERMLRKVATKGVVALFNAIAQHQKAVDSIADTEGAGDKIAASKRPGSVVKAVAAQQSSFLDLLRTTTQKEATKKGEEETNALKTKATLSGDLFKSRKSQKEEDEEELEYENDEGDDEAEF